MRHVDVSKQVKKELDKLDGRSKSWQKAILNQLEDESNSLEDIMETFDPLRDDLKGYYKAKNRSLGIRIVFRIISKDKIEIFKVDNGLDEKHDEVVQVIAAGRRDKIYGIARRRASTIKAKEEKATREQRRSDRKNKK